MRLLSLAVAAVFVAAAPAALADATVKDAPKYHLTPGAEQTPEMTAAIKEADAALFAAVFDRCDVDKIATMITDDFRFVHDKSGESSRTKFLDDLRGHCARLKTGEDFAARRELVPESLEVWPLNGYGALEIGVHRFYAVTPDKPDQMTETGNFMILWKKVDGAWKMAESISYGHKLAQ